MRRVSVTLPPSSRGDRSGEESMALRERVPATGSRSVTKRSGRHRAGSHRPAVVVVPEQRAAAVPAAHRWITAEADERARRREARRAPLRVGDEPGTGGESLSLRAEAARSAAAGLAGARLATALVGRVVADCRREAATRLGDRIATAR